MVVHPTNGTVYVSNTDANNMDRFEGSGATTLRGELHREATTPLEQDVLTQRQARVRRMSPILPVLQSPLFRLAYAAV